MAYCVHRKDEFFVAQCLNVDVSSFGATRGEAVELYFEGESADSYTPVTDAAVGQELVNALAPRLGGGHPHFGAARLPVCFSEG